MNYIVLDLEMCMVPKYLRAKEFNHKTEIIQIGAVKLNEQYDEISRFSIFVKPQYGYIDSFIEQLTGISPKQVEKAPVLANALNEFLQWIGEEEAVCVSWSMSDAKQFRLELKSKGILNDRMRGFLDTWMDCQQMFGQATNSTRVWGLNQAIYATDIQAEGHMHDGLMDAANTAAILRLIKTQPDFKLVDIYESLRREETDHLTYSLGSLLEGIELKAM